jgi:hypothetical protein
VGDEVARQRRVVGLLEDDALAVRRPPEPGEPAQLLLRVVLGDAVGARLVAVDVDWRGVEGQLAWRGCRVIEGEDVDFSIQGKGDLRLVRAELGIGPVVAAG